MLPGGLLQRSSEPCLEGFMLTKNSDPVVTCNPAGYPTSEYIANHPEPYANPNLTLWKDTNYTWPTNTLVDGCT
jgi:hypothetical protein